MVNCTFENGNQASLRHVTVGLIIEKDGKILFVKRAPDLLEGGKWDLPGGFLDRDETASQGALREALEETGWKCEIVTILKINSNPNRANEDRQNVEFMFIGKAIEKIAEADTESSLVEWIEIEEINQLGETAFDKKETLELYLKYRENPFELPVLI